MYTVKHVERQGHSKARSVRTVRKVCSSDQRARWQIELVLFLSFFSHKLWLQGQWKKVLALLSQFNG